jgi:N-acyl-D-amino-acid deacylase
VTPTYGRLKSASRPMRLVAVLTLAVLAFGQTDAPFDLVILNGAIIDGSGVRSRRADVAVRNGVIAKVGTLAAPAARGTLDAAGLTIAPGFIDVHTHADDLAQHPAADNFVRMGVTTVVAGNCGGSPVDIAAALAAISDRGAAINFATLIGHNSVRREVMGTERRAPTAGELTRMKGLVWRAMADGAVGFSTGLQYVPGTYADQVEIVELARVAARAGGLYASHMRNEGSEIEKSVAETIAVGETTGCPVQISHLKIDSPKRWGASATALRLIDQARRRGVKVVADQYVYTAASSTLGIRFPSWLLEGGQTRINERLGDEATWGRIRAEMRGLLEERGLADYSFAIIADYRADRALNGLSIKQVAARWHNRDDLDAQLDVMRQMLQAGGASMVYHFMSEDDIGRIARYPHVAFASDGSLIVPQQGMPHPRSYGNAVRVLARYVRERGVLTLEEAVRRMTSLPATHFKFAQRGLIKEGYAADLVVFDPRTVRDAATYEKPHAYAEGLPYVIVNGIVVVRNGEHTGARPGAVLHGARRAHGDHQRGAHGDYQYGAHRVHGAFRSNPLRGLSEPRVETTP